ncbi:MAG: hypothetical protein JMM79_00330 [Candidatus Xiphinematobacter sp.]|nr:MAG: hypothetical protein JMM79_00330 [Candidatus Xiphinematobacter sp.]
MRRGRAAHFLHPPPMLILCSLSCDYVRGKLPHTTSSVLPRPRVLSPGLEHKLPKKFVIAQIELLIDLVREG